MFGPAHEISVHLAHTQRYKVVGVGPVVGVPLYVVLSSPADLSAHPLKPHRQEG